MNQLLKIIILNLFLFSAYSAPAQLIKDLNTVRRPLSPYLPHAQSGNKIFFTRATEAVGMELWVTDGTPGGTVFLKDIYPGAQSGFPLGFSPAVIGGQPGTYFFAESPSEGTELWVSDGTADGTKVVKDIRPGTESSISINLTLPEILTFPDSSYAVFAADDGVNGNELWVTNGTSAGTARLTDLVPGSGSSNPTNFIYTGSLIAFAATSSTNGRELFGTNLIAVFPISDIRPGTASSNPQRLTLANNKLIYNANDGVNGEALWETDLASTLSSLVKDFNPTNTSSETTSFGHQAFSSSLTTLFALNPSSVENNLLVDVVATNGTTAGTSAVGTLDCLPGTLYNFYYGSVNSGFARNINGHQVFPCQNLNNSKSELYVTDAVAGSTRILKDIFPGDHSSDVFVLYPGNNKVIFPANNSVHGNELWTTDGTTGGTSLLADLNPGEASSINQESLFYANIINKNIPTQTASLISATVGNSNKIFYTDGSASNTRAILDDSSTFSAGSSPSEFFALGSGVLFSAGDSKFGTELFYTDGTSAKTALIKNIFKSGNSNPSNFRKLGNKAIFTADHPSFGKELWVTNGKAAGTSIVKNLKIGSVGSDPVIATATLKGKYLFSADSAFGRELWITDGKKAGTKLVKDIALGAASGLTTDPIIVLGKKAIFSATNATTGKEIWVTDGTKNGTILLKDIVPGSGSSSPANFTVLGKNVYFSAFTADNGVELWKTNGTPAGTILVKDITPGVTGSDPRDFVSSGAVIFFTANTAESGRELWRTNGTAAGTFLVNDLTPGGTSSNFYNMSAFPGSRVLFSIYNSTSGEEPWIAKSVAGSATLLKDIYPGTSSSYATKFYTVPGKIRAYFGAYDPVNGTELWQTNGTPAGTVLVQDINPGIDSSSPTNFFAKGKKLFMSATATTSGAEPFIYQIP